MSCKKYKPVRFPLEAYNNFVEKKRKMEETARQLLGTPVEIPLTRLFNIASRHPLTIKDVMLIKIAKRKKRK